MEFTWGGNFLSKKLHNKAMQRKSDFGEDGTIFLSKIPQPPESQLVCSLFWHIQEKLKTASLYQF